MAELKPCPFCCGKKLGVVAAPKIAWVYCHSCLVEGPTALTREGAIDAWNKRS